MSTVYRNLSEPDGKIATFIVQHLLDQLARRGTDAESVLHAAGVHPPRLDQASPWVPLSVCTAMIREAVMRTGDPMLGLRFSQSTFTGGFGVIGHLVEACPTLGDVVNAIGRYEQLLGDMFFSPLIQEPGASVWSVEARACPPDIARFMIEFGLGTRYQVLNLLRERRSSAVTEVRFRHAPPDREDDRDFYESVFHCPIRFNQPHSGLVLTPGALAFPLRHFNDGLKDILEVEAERHLAERQREPDFVEHTRSRLLVLVGKGVASREALAAELGISSRHLHRELSRAGTSYSALLDAIRLARAMELLETEATLEQIGKRLGFQEAASFMRWYRQRTGQAAGRMRSERRGAVEEGRNALAKEPGAD